MAGRRIALLVATDGYVDPGLNQLRSPARGADELAALLKDEAVGRFDFVRTLTNRPKEEIEREIEALLSHRAPDDLVLLYLACHGIRNDTDRLFFATIGTDLSRPHTTAVRADLIHQLLDECEARTKIVLLDCCYSGLFHRATPMSPGLVDVEAALAGRGTFVITASTALEYAYEGEQLTMDNARPVSRFTAALNEGLGTGLADLDRDGVITPDELYTFVHDVVVNQSGPEQKPTKSGQYEGHVAIAYAARTDPATGLPPRGTKQDQLVLGSLLPPPVDTPDRGFVCDAWEGASKLLVPIGRAPAPAGGDLTCLDLSSRSGNVAVIGRLGSGKTTLLRSLTMALTLTHTPHEAEFYLLEGAVNRLGVLRSMPHVKQLAAAHEHEAVGRVLGALKDAVASRRALFRDLDIDSVEEFRELRAAGRLPHESGSDVFLVVDGWLDFDWEMADFAQEVHRITNAGLNYGVHLIASARRWSDFGPSLLGLLGTRVELPLDDPAESQIDTVLSGGLGVGWGLTHRRRFRVAVPHLEEVADAAEARRSLTETVQRMRERWLGVQPDSAAPPRPEIPFTELYGIGDAARFDASTAWSPRHAQERLRVPIGVGEDGRPVMLDLKEPAQGGMGPHGLCIGATGSGKSELLRTLVLGLAVTHSPRSLNFVLVDFKGGATFAGTDRLPHLSALISGLADDPALVDRMGEALDGELRRRQELLRSAGNYSNITAYEEARAAGAPLAALPSLLVVIDEFSELLAVRPDFLELLVMIGRVGRALGVHLLLASQRLDDGRLRGLDTYLSYRIGLRTFSSAESRRVIGVPDAYHLPPLPGSGYLRYDTDLTRFRAAYVSAPQPSAPALRTTLPAPRPDLPADGVSPRTVVRAYSEDSADSAYSGDSAYSEDSGDSEDSEDSGDYLLTPPEPPGRLPVGWAAPGGPSDGTAPDQAPPGGPALAPDRDSDPGATLPRGVTLPPETAPLPWHPAFGSPPGDAPAEEPELRELPGLPALAAPGSASSGGSGGSGAFADSLLDVLVRRTAGQGPPAHQVWLPPLGDPVALDTLLPQLETTPERGLHPPHYGALGRRKVPAGLVDRPDQQRREPLILDFSGPGGNGLIVGAPQSGKSTLLRTVALSLALTHTPAEVQFYFLDFGGGGLQQLTGLPHTGSVAGRLEPEQVRRTVAEVTGVLAQREEFFRAEGIDSMAAYREGRAHGRWPEHRWGDVFLIVDNWSAFKSQYEELEGAVADLGTRGLAFGVHLLLTAGRYMEVRLALRDSLGTRVELRLSDPTESEISRKAAEHVPIGVPGRGLVAGYHFLAAVPRLDGRPTADSGLTEATAHLVTAVRSQWAGPPAPPVRVLPALLPERSLPTESGRTSGEILLGLDETTLQPFGVDFETDPWLVVFGEGESGKTSLLRLLAHRIAERYTPEQAQLIVVDYRRSLLGELPPEHVMQYVPGLGLQPHVAALADLARRRLPAPDITPDQLRDRSWYTGPDLFLLVDDYDLVATASGNPLLPLLEHLPFARDVGLRLVLCRSSAGASRALYEPLLQYLREQGAPGLMLSGDRSEGAFFGSVPPSRQPPGRGTLSGRRNRSRQVQLAYLPPRSD
ncbi:type VII secretion protein EccCb [Streptomyces qinzhouensis]|uniref:Type VII secretion protein EccCb n=1 Tax=Streptomyces qinzhouensis TaxID=2599401 RepID=A0A5B8IGG7_9ACTN|nr:type VII secretion protein EccCb [Streptomyces qinzhouensis]QDY77262.1 type VII secretion protein EccCb [Streptomyces qinzhouensis]